ncbi:translation initiation factor Sui1 [Reinekea blandensis]|uniref:Translation initiation factor 1 (EIF-1/SUI1) and related protein n=1 Tax=Reinekea blandensis MED297 TaxID=314283 RepID=A4BDA0_9GAMM|nr:translation initiation factor Sui1 [Reinekea blandensis]EAR09844.1 Translation initiation factor 1 (eIF-1/SUI1) and related protein [Reinekea sp. MED297] [Reinekea blandensis MED297]
MAKKKAQSLSDLDSLFGSSRVYSTEDGRICPDCDHPVDDCQCQRDIVPDGDGIVRLRRETKGRKGKGVTLVDGVLLAPSDLKKLAKELKARCGTGGTVKDGVIEIQGEHRDLLLSVLTDKGYQVKKAGG